MPNHKSKKEQLCLTSCVPGSSLTCLSSCSSCLPAIYSPPSSPCLKCCSLIPCSCQPNKHHSSPLARDFQS
ncbi:hypothetical protein NQZ68_014461 [Dissostichus eleginoides]|nr:hypothetical protein NQZ68_014461 [Dissostichus eleginoides]